MNGISEINQLFDDILIIWPAPVYIMSMHFFWSCLNMTVYIFDVISDRQVSEKKPIYVFECMAIESRLLDRNILLIKSISFWRACVRQSTLRRGTQWQVSVTTEGATCSATMWHKTQSMSQVFGMCQWHPLTCHRFLACANGIHWRHRFLECANGIHWHVTGFWHVPMASIDVTGFWNVPLKTGSVTEHSGMCQWRLCRCHVT